MAETHVDDLEGERLRFNDDTWELTGRLDVRRNGGVIDAAARKPDRVRGSTGSLRFELRDPPASLNPGNLGTFTAALEPEDGGHTLVVGREHATNHYRLESLLYD